ncbi:MAG: hypothetical protein ACYDGZ_26945 [Desulfosporosinus fructosivorans]
MSSTLYTSSVIPKQVISYTQISAVGTTGFPVEYGSILMTNATYATSGYQEYRPNLSDGVYMRKWGSGVWGDWLKVGGGAGTTELRPTTAKVGYTYFVTR